MNRTRSISISLLVAVVGVVVLVFAAGGSARKASSAAATVGVKQTSLGKVLVGANGRTLYLFLADKPGVSRLSAAGFAVWPAATATGVPTAAGGASASAIKTISTRGKRQVTYAGHPLYYFVGDQRAGSTAGQGLLEFGARWYVLSPAGKAVTKAPVTSAPATTESTGGGYSY